MSSKKLNHGELYDVLLATAHSRGEWNRTNRKVRDAEVSTLQEVARRLGFIPEVGTILAAAYDGVLYDKRNVAATARRRRNENLTG